MARPRAKAKDAVRELTTQYASCVTIALFRAIMDSYTSIMSGANRPNGKNINGFVLETIQEIRAIPMIELLGREANRHDALMVFYTLEQSALANPHVSDASLDFITWVCAQPMDTLSKFLWEKGERLYDPNVVNPCELIKEEFEAKPAHERWALFDVANQTHNGDSPMHLLSAAEVEKRLGKELTACVKERLAKKRAAPPAPPRSPSPDKRPVAVTPMRTAAAQLAPAFTRAETPPSNTMPISNIWAPMARTGPQINIAVTCDSIEEAEAVHAFVQNYRGSRGAMPANARQRTNTIA